MPRTQLLLVRHGETDDNRNQVFQGQLGCGLNALGRDQATRLAARLTAATARPIAVYTSDLDRARETADILADALCLAVESDPDLREVYLGAWQGLTHTEIAERFPEEHAAWRAGRDVRRGGGETYAELGARVARSLERIAEARAGATALVVSHGAALKAFVGRVLGMGSEGLRAFHVQANTAVTVVERDGGTWRLAVWNDAAHLGDAVLEALEARPG